MRCGSCASFQIISLDYFCPRSQKMAHYCSKRFSQLSYILHNLEIKRNPIEKALILCPLYQSPDREAARNHWRDINREKMLWQVHLTTFNIHSCLEDICSSAKNQCTSQNRYEYQAICTRACVWLYLILSIRPVPQFWVRVDHFHILIINVGCWVR